MGRTLLVAISAVLGLASLVSAADIPLVENGRSDWAIEVGVNCTSAERLAAQEIVRYVKQMSGAELPVRPQKNKQFPGHTIRVGSTQPSSNDGYEIEVESDPVAVAITGYNPRSTLVAAYRFLDALGCRFLAPQFDHYRGSGEIIPHRPTLAIPSDLHAKSTAALKCRKLYVEEGHSHTPENLKQLVEWMPKVGYNTLVVPTNYQGHDRVKWDNFREAVTTSLLVRGITIEVGGHGYQNFLNAAMEGGALFGEHPDWFGQDAKGVRHKEAHWVFCTAKPAAVEYLTKNFLAYIKDRPEIQIYDFWPPDGAKWCECETCVAMGSPSDRQAILLGQVRRAVAEVRPDLRLEMIAYASYVSPPEHATVDPSVLIDFCPISQQFNWQIDDAESTRNADYAANLKAWRAKFAGDISIYSYYRKYAWDSLPLVIPHYIQHDLKWYHMLPAQGVSTYSEPGDWFTYELNHYTLAALAWDPDCDVDAVIRKFAEARYGSAAPQAIAAYAALEDVVRTTCSVPNIPKRTADGILKGKERLAQASSSVNGAAASASDPSIKYNLNRLSLMIDYALGDLDVQLLAVQGNKVAAVGRAKELFGHLSEHFDDGVFLSRNGRLSESRLLNRLGLQGKTAAAE